MSKKFVNLIIIFLACILLFPSHLGFADEPNQLREIWTLEKYATYFYNRYSAHFDKNGLFYMAPEYGVTEWKAPKTAREYISLAMYYKYRSQNGDYIARDILKNAIKNAKRELSKRPFITQSFEDAETLFLMVRLLEGENPIVSGEALSSPLQRGRGSDEDSAGLDKNELLDWIARYVDKGIRVVDTENRAIISAAHWQYIVDYLHIKGKISHLEAKRHSKMIKNKIDFAIRTNITKDGLYVEGRFNDFTPHYHAVSAYMLMFYSKLTGEKKYYNLSFKMYQNLKMISFSNGMVEAKIGHRPVGLGSQFYLMAGMLGKAFNDPDYNVYLFYGFGNRFFSDPSHPNRLEYHSTIEGTSSQFHDDYSFVDAMELALSIPSLRNGDFKFNYYMSIPEIKVRVGFVKENTGQEIIFEEKKFILGTNGNWARFGKTD
ncbi:hypothetical protein ACFL2L_00755 [Patescibacteria group bacterium]